VPHELAPPGTFRHAEVLAWLIEKGAPVDLPDIAGLTALHHSVMNNRIGEIPKILLRAGANPNAVDKYGTLPLHSAMMAAQAEAVEDLLEFGADPTIKDNDGIPPIDLLRNCTPLVHAAFQNWKTKQEGVKAPLEDKNKCAVCSQPGNSQCAKCRAVRYCGKECQGMSSAPERISYQIY